MAFATSNVKPGIDGVYYTLSGEWSGAVGDAAGSISVAGTRIYDYDFNNQDSDSPKEKPEISISTSGRITTISVHNHQSVTNGRFRVVYK